MRGQKLPANGLAAVASCGYKVFFALYPVTERHVYGDELLIFRLRVRIEPLKERFHQQV